MERERGQFGQERGRQFNRCSRTRLLLNSTNDPDLASHPRSRSRFRLPPPALALSPSKYKKKIAGKKALAIAQAGLGLRPGPLRLEGRHGDLLREGKHDGLQLVGLPLLQEGQGPARLKGGQVLRSRARPDGRRAKVPRCPCGEDGTGRRCPASSSGGGGFIGGFGDGSPGLKPLNDSGELDGKLKAAGAL